MLEEILKIIRKSVQSIDYDYSKSTVIINGEVIQESKNRKNIQITIEGDCGVIKGSANQVTVKGSVTGGVTNHNGNIAIDGFVVGDVENMNGDIRIAGEVKGDVSNMNGDIRR